MTTITLNIPMIGTDNLPVTLQEGGIVFIVGANGTGKSSLMQRLFSGNRGNAKRIAAHRQTWFEHNTVSLTTADRRSIGSQFEDVDNSPDSRHRDPNASHRPNAALYDLVNKENRRARGI